MVKMLVVVWCVVVAACGSDAKPEPISPVDESFAKAESFRAEMCACRDTPCTQAVLAKIQEQKAGPPLALTDADRLRAADINGQIYECLRKAMGVP